MTGQIFTNENSHHSTSQRYFSLTSPVVQTNRAQKSNFLFKLLYADRSVDAFPETSKRKSQNGKDSIVVVFWLLQSEVSYLVWVILFSEGGWALFNPRFIPRRTLQWSFVLFSLFERFFSVLFVSSRKYICTSANHFNFHSLFFTVKVSHSALSCQPIAVPARQRKPWQAVWRILRLISLIWFFPSHWTQLNRSPKEQTTNGRLLWNRLVERKRPSRRRHRMPERIWRPCGEWMRNATGLADVKQHPKPFFQSVLWSFPSEQLAWLIRKCHDWAPAIRVWSSGWSICTRRNVARRNGKMNFSVLSLVSLQWSTLPLHSITQRESPSLERLCTPFVAKSYRFSLPIWNVHKSQIYSGQCFQKAHL